MREFERAAAFADDVVLMKHVPERVSAMCHWLVDFVGQGLGPSLVISPECQVEYHDAEYHDIVRAVMTGGRKEEGSPNSLHLHVARDSRERSPRTGDLFIFDALPWETIFRRRETDDEY
jgi:hypothetical protein